MSRSMWVQPWRWRWLGYRRWHRWAVGPLCFSIYVYPPGYDGSRLFISRSWHFRNQDGEWRHLPSFKRWLRRVRAVHNGGDGTDA